VIDILKYYLFVYSNTSGKISSFITVVNLTDSGKFRKIEVGA
jgi:hypothetical protein